MKQMEWKSTYKNVLSFEQSCVEWSYLPRMLEIRKEENRT